MGKWHNGFRSAELTPTARGFDTGGADGVIGPNTRSAISAYQSSIGVPATGEPSPELLRSLR